MPHSFRFIKRWNCDKYQLIRLFIPAFAFLFRNHMASLRYLHRQKMRTTGNVVRWEFKSFDKFKLHIACVNFNNLLNVAICFVVVSPRFRFIWVFLTRMNFFVASSFSNSIVFYRYNNVCLRLVINSPNLIGNCLLSLPPFTVIHALKVAQPL